MTMAAVSTKAVSPVTTFPLAEDGANSRNPALAPGEGLAALAAANFIGVEEGLLLADRGYGQGKSNGQVCSHRVKWLGWTSDGED